MGKLKSFEEVAGDRIDNEDVKQSFMEEMTRSHLYDDYLLEMANLTGNQIVCPGKKPFSFYFSQRRDSQSIRVKPLFNQGKLFVSLTGTLKLNDDWEYIPGSNDKDVSDKDIEEMKQFFRDYIVIFCAVWDVQLQESSAQDYFRGLIDFKEMIQSFEFYEDNKNVLDKVNTIEELEDVCRKYNLVNFYGNPQYNYQR